MVFRHPAHSRDDLRERGPVGGRFAPDRPQKHLRVDLLHELVRVILRDGRHGEGDVLQRLGEDAAQAEHHHRAEEQVTDQADHELALAADHMLDEHTVERDPRSRGPRFQRPISFAHFCLVDDAEQHQPGVGLVLDGGGGTLHHDGVADPGGEPDSLVGRGRGPTQRHRDVIGGEELLAGLFVESGSAGRQRLLDESAAGPRHAPRSRTVHTHVRPLDLIRNMHQRSPQYP